jgi:glutamate racemase
VLGCTHYPLLKEAIAAVVGREVTLVDSALATAKAASRSLETLSMVRTSQSPPERHYLVTDTPAGFERVAEQFLGVPVSGTRQIDL